MIRKSAVLLLLAAAMGCATSTPPVDREKKLLSMASEEAQLITDPRDRLTRELNFAFDQTARNQKPEARQSLAHAVETLKTPEAQKMDWRIRIAGWVSVSELSRGVDDTAVADAACDQAVALLHQIDPVAERPRYVLGVAQEVRALRGDAASAKLLVESAAWTAEIKEPLIRRQVLVDITRNIICCDDYPGALAALRTDSDAAWRSDSLRSLAIEFPPALQSDSGFHLFAQVGAVGGVNAHAVPLESQESQPPNVPYNVPVDFQSVFKRQK